MFGRLEINKDEMKVKDLRRYHAYYCGVCHSLKKVTGGVGRLTLTYDMTFLAMFLDGLFDTDACEKKERCILRPGAKHLYMSGSVCDYAADMNILLFYDNLLDRWYDSKNVGAKISADMLSHARKKAAARHPEESAAVSEYVSKLHDIEKNNDPDFEAAANATGHMLGKVFSGFSDEWKDELFAFGFFTGKFIYLADAYDDYPEDIKKNAYNPFAASGKTPDADGRAALESTAAEAARIFERLPIVLNADILRNVIFSGIWGKVGKQKKGQHKDDQSV